MINRHNLIRIFSFVLMIMSFFYVYDYFSQNAAELVSNQKFISWLLALGCLAITIIGHLGSCYVWHLSLRNEYSSVPFGESIRSWSFSRVARYIPGKVASFLVRYGLLPLVPKLAVTKAFIIEFFSVVVSIAILGVAVVVLYSELAHSFVMLIFLVPLLFVFVIVFISYISSYFDTIHPFISAFLLQKSDVAAILKVSRLQILVCLIHGAVFYMLLTVFIQVTSDLFIYIVAIYYLSGLIGQLSILTPSGLGVREAALLFLLSIAIDPSLHSVLIFPVLWARVILLFSEALLAIFSEVYYRVMSSKG